MSPDALQPLSNAVVVNILIRHASNVRQLFLVAEPPGAYKSGPGAGWVQQSLQVGSTTLEAIRSMVSGCNRQNPADFGKTGAKPIAVTGTLS